MESFSSDGLTAIVKNENEENVDRLQAAWALLDKRGLKDLILNELTEQDENKKLKLDDLIDPENEEKYLMTILHRKLNFWSAARSARMTAT